MPSINTLHCNTWSDAGTTPFHLAGKTLNSLVAHEDWMVTCLAAAGAPDIKDQLLKGGTFAGRQYRAPPDGYNQLAYPSGKTPESPRKEFW